MSQTFELCCPETHQALWIGQGWGSMTNLYTKQEKLERLKAFLNAHRGKALYFVESQAMFEAPWDDDTPWQEWGHDAAPDSSGAD